jgi:hypothetical protein
MLVCFLSRVTGFAVAAVLFGLSFFPQRADSQEPAAQRAVLQGRSLHSVSIVNAARLALHARQGRMRRPRVVTNDDLPGESLPSPEVPAARPLEQASQLAKPEQPGLEIYRVPPDAALEPQQPGPPPGFFVVSGKNLQLEHVRPGQQGLYVGFPRLETAPPSPEAVQRQMRADIYARISPPENAVQPADPPVIAAAKQQLASALVDLDYAERLVALDQDAYYSHPGFSSSRYADERDRIEADQEDAALLRARVERLRARLAQLESQQPGADR